MTLSTPILASMLLFAGALLALRSAASAAARRSTVKVRSDRRQSGRSKSSN